MRQRGPLTAPTGPHPDEAWPVLLLLSAKPSPVSYRWLASRLEAGIRRGYEIAADQNLPAPIYDRAATRQFLDDVLAQLESLDVVTIDRADSDQRITPIPAASRRFWWSLLVVRLLSELRPTHAVAEIVESLDNVSERTVWRWLKGTTTPSAAHLAAILTHFKPDLKRPLIDLITRTILRSHAQIENCGLSPAEKRRVQKWSSRELQPLANLIGEMTRSRGKPR